MLGYLSLDIICSSKLTVFLELRFRKTVRYSEQIMSADKYPSIFWCQMEAIVYLARLLKTPRSLSVYILITYIAWLQAKLLLQKGIKKTSFQSRDV